jgi:hypothetical protein
MDVTINNSSFPASRTRSGGDKSIVATIICSIVEMQKPRLNE